MDIAPNEIILSTLISITGGEIEAETIDLVHTIAWRS